VKAGDIDEQASNDFAFGSLPGEPLARYQRVPIGRQMDWDLLEDHFVHRYSQPSLEDEFGQLDIGLEDPASTSTYTFLAVNPGFEEDEVINLIRNEEFYPDFGYNPVMEQVWRSDMFDQFDLSLYVQPDAFFIPKELLFLW